MMPNNYYVIEIQTNPDSSGNLVFGFANKGEAEDKFLALRTFARQSQVMKHTVIWIDANGVHQEKPAVYVHPVEQQPAAEGGAAE